MINVALLSEVLVEVESVIASRFGSRVSRIGRRFDAADLYQTTCLKAVESFEGCKAQSVEELRHWVLTIAKSVYCNACESSFASKRSLKREECAVGVATDESREGYQPAASDLTAVEQMVVSESVEMAFGRMTDSQAKAVRMRYLDDASYEAIAADMGLTVNSVRLLVSRGLKAAQAA